MRRPSAMLIGGLVAGVLLVASGCSGPVGGEAPLSSLSLSGLESRYREQRQSASVGTVSSRARAVRTEAVRRFASWSPAERRAVAEGRIWAHATREQVWWAWGPPSRTQRSQGRELQREVWSYDISRVAGSASIYQREVRFHDGRVVRWSAEQ